MGFFPSLLFAGRVDFCECSSCSVSDPGWTWSLLQEVKADGQEVRSVCTPGGEGGAGSQVCARQERMWCSLAGGGGGGCLGRPECAGPWGSAWSPGRAVCRPAGPSLDAVGRAGGGQPSLRVRVQMLGTW